MICPECNRIVKRLEFHHDPPKSVIFKENGKRYFIDKDGKKKLVILHSKNRRMCWKCHKKANKGWGLRSHKFQWKKPSSNKL